MKNKTYRGIIPIVHNISEEMISSELKKYRKICPEDKRTDKELRPFAINQIILDKQTILGIQKLSQTSGGSDPTIN